MAKAAKPGKTVRTVKIDGVDYEADQLSKDARQQIVNLRSTDQEILRLEQQLAIFRTARAAYAQALKTMLEEKPATEH
jgi:hypothetical protein